MEGDFLFYEPGPGLMAGQSQAVTALSNRIVTNSKALEAKKSVLVTLIDETGPKKTRLLRGMKRLDGRIKKDSNLLYFKWKEMFSFLPKL